MHDLVLHHYEQSPFSEKVRLLFGMKGLHWKSVDVPVMMPKPDVVALTGGYRRTPFMQIGADIWCDSALMCRVIDRLHPDPALYPDEFGGIAQIVAQWADSALFWVAVPLTIQYGGPAGVFPDVSPEFLKAFGTDRASMTAGVRRAGVHDHRAQLANFLGWAEQHLGDGRPFLLGSLACIADFSVYHPLWFMQRSARAATLLLPYPKLLAWYARMRAFGHGHGSVLSSADALAIAASAAAPAACAVDATLGFEAGAEVTVNALDYGADPVSGRLVGLSLDEVVLQRHDARAGTVQVHFPRIGFQIRMESR